MVRLVELAALVTSALIAGSMFLFTSFVKAREAMGKPWLVGTFQGMVGTFPWMGLMQRPSSGSSLLVAVNC